MPTVPVADGKTLRATGPVAFLASAFLALGCGCDHPVAQALHPANVAHELRPHRLWRKNQNRPLSENAYFSVPPSAGNQLGGSGSQQFIGNRNTK